MRRVRQQDVPSRCKSKLCEDAGRTLPYDIVAAGFRKDDFQPHSVFGDTAPFFGAHPGKDAAPALPGLDAFVTESSETGHIAAVHSLDSMGAENAWLGRTSSGAMGPAANPLFDDAQASGNSEWGREQLVKRTLPHHPPGSMESRTDSQ
jgi:hypothetical protein